DARYRRNRLRQVVMPALDAFDPAARRLLARAAEILAQEDHLLEEQAARLESSIEIDSPAFQSIPVALQRRLLRRLRPALSFAQVEALRSLSEPSPTMALEPVPAREVSAEPCGCDPSTF